MPYPGRRFGLRDWTVLFAIAVSTGLLLADRTSQARHAVDAGDASFGGAMPASAHARHGSARTLPARNWKDRLLYLYNAISEHRVIALAAGMTFYSLLAIFPALAALVAIYSLFADPASITTHLDSLSGFLPGGAIDVARDQLVRVAAKGRQTLGWTFIIGLGISLWSANAAMKSLFDTLNIIYGEREARGLVKLNLVSLTFTLCGIVVILLAIAAVVVLPVALTYVGLSDRTDLLLRAGRWPALFVVLAFSLAVIYRFGPSREHARWRWISWGSVIAVVLWLAASALFSWYAANFGTYNQTYGSLGAVIGFMTWLWISAITILVGAEVDGGMERGFLPDPAERSGTTQARA